MGIDSSCITQLQSEMTDSMAHGGSWVRIPSGARIFSEIPVGSTIISFLMCLYHSHIRSVNSVLNNFIVFYTPYSEMDTILVFFCLIAN